MLSRLGAQPVLLGTGLLTAALGMANVGLLALAAIPLLLVVAASFLVPPRVVRATVTADRRRLFAGQPVTVRVRVELRPGWGPIDLAAKLPATFALVTGSNHLHRWCSRSDRELTWEFVARPDRRGIHPIGPVVHEATHPTLLGATRRATMGEPAWVRVQPRWARLRRVRSRRLRSKSPIPEQDLSQTGVPTTEFEDIRAYQWGDSPRSVNWKASARLSGRLGEDKLLVNQYEREGKRSIWIFLDAGTQGLVGTSIDNAFERRLEGAYTIASHFLSRGFSVGFTLYNCGQITSLYPDLSSKQKHRILELVHALGPTQAAHGLLEAVQAAKGHLARSKTLAFVVSSMGQSFEPLEAGLRALRAQLGHRRGRVPIALVDVNPYGLVPDAQSYALAKVTALLQRPALRGVQNLGIICLPWDPARQTLASLLRRVHT